MKIGSNSADDEIKKLVTARLFHLTTFVAHLLLFVVVFAIGALWTGPNDPGAAVWLVFWIVTISLFVRIFYRAWLHLRNHLYQREMLKLHTDPPKRRHNPDNEITQLRQEVANLRAQLNQSHPDHDRITGDDGELITDESPFYDDDPHTMKLSH